MLAAMKLWPSLALALCACSAGDDVVDGSRGACEFGGTLTQSQCPPIGRTSEDACWRLVDCGAIPLHHETNENTFDWDNCVDRLDTRYTDDRKRIIIACIAASTCDEVRSGRCIDFGEDQ